MESEFGDVGRYVLEKQCRDLNIDPRYIEGGNLPRLSRIFSGLMSRFGDDKARRISIAINNLRAQEIEKEEPQENTCPECATPVLVGSEKCNRCGATLIKEDTAPKLFSQETYGSKSAKGGLNIVDVSQKAAKKHSG